MQYPVRPARADERRRKPQKRGSEPTRRQSLRSFTTTSRPRRRPPSSARLHARAVPPAALSPLKTALTALWLLRMSVLPTDQASPAERGAAGSPKGSACSPTREREAARTSGLGAQPDMTSSTPPLRSDSWTRPAKTLRAESLPAKAPRARTRGARSAKRWNGSTSAHPRARANGRLSDQGPTPGAAVRSVGLSDPFSSPNWSDRFARPSQNPSITLRPLSSSS